MAMYTIHPGTSLARVQQKSMTDEVMAKPVWMLIGPDHCAARSGMVRPKKEHPFMMATLRFSAVFSAHTLTSNWRGCRGGRWFGHK